MSLESVNRRVKKLLRHKPLLEEKTPEEMSDDELIYVIYQAVVAEAKTNGEPVPAPKEFYERIQDDEYLEELILKWGGYNVPTSRSYARCLPWRS